MLQKWEIPEISLVSYFEPMPTSAVTATVSVLREFAINSLIPLSKRDFLCILPL